VHLSARITLPSSIGCTPLFLNAEPTSSQKLCDSFRRRQSHHGVKCVSVSSLNETKRKLTKTRHCKKHTINEDKSARECDSPISLLEIACNRQQIVDSRQQAADSRQQAAGSRQRTADGRRQTADSIQHTEESRKCTHVNGNKSARESGSPDSLLEHLFCDLRSLQIRFTQNVVTLRHLNKCKLKICQRIQIHVKTLRTSNNSKQSVKI
jgi:hypothetical protein